MTEDQAGGHGECKQGKAADENDMDQRDMPGRQQGHAEIAYRNRRKSDAQGPGEGASVEGALIHVHLTIEVAENGTGAE